MTGEGAVEAGLEGADVLDGAEVGRDDHLPRGVDGRLLRARGINRVRYFKYHLKKEK